MAVSHQGQRGVTPARSLAEPSNAAASGSKRASKHSGSPSKQKPASAKAGSKRTDPEGMLPQVSVKVPDDRRAMVLDVAKNLFPNKKSLGELKHGERQRWIALACSLLHGDADVSEQIAAVGEVVGEAEVALHRKRALAEERERKKREARDEEMRQAELDQQRQATEIEGERWQLQKNAWRQRLEQEGEREANGCWIERFLMAMMAGAFAVAIALLVVAAATGQSNPQSPSFTGWAVAAGGSGATGLLSLIMLTLYRMRLARKDLELFPEPAPPSAVPLKAADDASASITP